MCQEKCDLVQKRVTSVHVNEFSGARWRDFWYGGVTTVGSAQVHACVAAARREHERAGHATHPRFARV